MHSPTTSLTPSQSSYRPDIDGLRAIAVLAVVIFHASPRWLPGGFIGVDIFFVISGFLISGILLDGLARSDFSYADFYARRIRRIFPALSLVLSATFLFGWYILLPDEFRQLGKHVLASTGFIANLAFWNEAGYFDTAVEAKPLLHLWSLAVEEQFYILWPAVLIFAWRSKRVFFWTLFAIVVSFVVNVALVKRHPDFAFYLPLTRVWELGAGALLAWWVRNRGARRLPAPLRSLLVLAGLVCIGAGLVLINKNKSFPGYWALYPVVGACLCIGSGPDTWIHRRLLGSRPFVLVGLISYPLYLWHWPLLAYARVLQEGFADPPRTWRMAAVAIAVVMAWLTYRFVEQPIRHRRRRGVVAGLVGAMVALGVLDDPVGQPRHYDG
ncbi:MAG: acyltransferase, partial [Comamonadaceae bacterium]